MATKAMNACVDGGFKLVEFTLTTPGCLDTLADFRAKRGDSVLTGCGTIMDIQVRVKFGYDNISIVRP